MLRSETQARRNELLVRLTEAADLAQHGDPGGGLAALEHPLRQLAAALEGRIRASGDLPDRPDPDREDARVLRVWLEGVVTADRERAHAQAVERLLDAAGSVCSAIADPDCGRLAQLREAVRHLL